MLRQADKALAQRLKELRLRSRLTQIQVARAIGVSTALVSQYELGHTRIPYERHAAIAQALGCRQTALYATPGTPPRHAAL